jgi:hypothetical protein
MWMRECALEIFFREHETFSIYAYIQLTFELDIVTRWSSGSTKEALTWVFVCPDD